MRLVRFVCESAISKRESLEICHFFVQYNQHLILVNIPTSFLIQLAQYDEFEFGKGFPSFRWIDALKMSLFRFHTRLYFQNAIHHYRIQILYFLQSKHIPHQKKPWAQTIKFQIIFVIDCPFRLHHFRMEIFRCRIQCHCVSTATKMRMGFWRGIKFISL